MTTTLLRRPCSEPGCPSIATNKAKCLPHYRQQNNSAHRNRMRAFYSSPAWRSVRLTVLTAHAICEDGLCTNRSAEVDHRIPMALGGAPLEYTNLQALCKPCHSRKTMTELNARG